ncbi:O-antigen translocase [Carboxylicivirga sp. M1479]|uniref:O-antigen translocase n=1 Tax=Carboxylicivirga sp. M1479 TaxID=2594476 RepID=UPI00163D7F90|nr:O-antigen translocase [Carboxylicivirga sp. M1479]
MINIFKKSAFLSISLKNSSQVLVRVFIGIINIKLIALLLGPTGLALVSQLQNFLQLSVNLAGAGINSGVVKHVSKLDKSSNHKQAIINTSFTIVIVVSVVVSGIIAFFNDFVSIYLFDSRDYSKVIFFAAIYIISTSLFNLVLSIINGLQKLRIFVVLNIIYFTSGFLIFIISIYFLGLNGALWAVLFQSIIAFSLGILKLRQLGFKVKLFFYRQIAVKLSKFSLMALISGLITPFVVIIIRKLIIQELSVHEAGIWDGVLKISTSYIGIATLPFSYYFLPTFSRLTDAQEIRDEVKRTILILVPLLLIVGFGIYASRILIIQLMLSREFSEASLIINWQIMGDGFKVLCWLLGLLLIAKEKVLAFIATELLSGIIFISTAYLLIPRLGIEGSTIAYFLENTLSFSVLCGVFAYYWSKK